MYKFDAKVTYSNLLNKLKRRRTIICIVVVYVCGYLVVHSPLCPDLYFLHWGSLEDVSCHYIETDNTLPRADSISFLPPAKSIFFHETSCKGNLNSRQACAVESAARAYPEWQINVLFAAPVTRFALKSSSLSVLRNYSNVNLSRVQVIKYARQTPLESLIAGGALNRTKWPISHTSDVLRYLSLYKFGGVYFDLDVVVTEAVDPLMKNWAARESAYSVGAGAMSFSRDEIGREMAKAAISDLKNRYRGDIWTNNGPGVMRRILMERCCATNVLEMSAATCDGFEIYDTVFFYPVHYRNASRYFVPGDIIGEDMVYTYHVWNSLSSQLRIHKDSPFAKIARRHCPDIYKLYNEDFGI